MCCIDTVSLIHGDFLEEPLYTVFYVIEVTPHLFVEAILELRSFDLFERRVMLMVLKVIIGPGVSESQAMCESSDPLRLQQ